VAGSEKEKIATPSSASASPRNSSRRTDAAIVDAAITLLEPSMT
jgi:hypothetical protein